MVTQGTYYLTVSDDTKDQPPTMIREWHSLSIVGREDWRRARLSKVMVVGRRRAEIRGAIPLGLGVSVSEPMSLPTMWVGVGLVMGRIGV